MTLLGVAWLGVVAATVAPAQTCPCVSSYDSAKSACTFSDPLPQLRLRTQMEGPLTLTAKRTWKGQPLPAFIPQKDEELSLQLMDVTSDGYFAVWRSLYGAKSKPNENPRARARLYDCKGAVLWTVELNELYSHPGHLELNDARYVDGVLYFNEACQSYAKEAGGKCSSLIALEPKQRKVLWKTDPLTSNGRFYVTKNYVVAVYAFTNEPRFVRVLARQNGKLVATAKLVGHHEWDELNGEDLHVRTEEGDEYFALDGLRAGTLKAIRPHAGPKTVAELGTFPKQKTAVSCHAAGATPKLVPVVQDRTDAAFSDDGRQQLYYNQKEALLFSDKHPTGLPITDNDYINHVVFSPAGDKVVLIGTQRGLAVHATDDGRLLRLIAEPKSDKGQHMVPFGVRFSGTDKLMFVGGCQQAQAKLFRVDVNGAAAPEVIGAPFKCQDAWAAPDARSYLVADDSKPGSVARMDASTGAATPIAQGTDDAPLSEVTVSTKRDWLCYARKWRWSVLFCQNTSDGRTINLGKYGRMTGFSETGARTVIAGGDQDRDTGKERERVFFVDLEAGTSTELLNAPNRAGGGFPALFGDGQVLAVPDYAALKTCDVSSGAAYTFNQPHLFGIFPMPGKKLQVTVNQERADGVHGDFFRIDLTKK
ncbi:MAG: hypothetical protein ABI488_17105 [Polyangiaceae bacterium]